MVGNLIKSQFVPTQFVNLIPERATDHPLFAQTNIQKQGPNPALSATNIFHRVQKTLLFFIEYRKLHHNSEKFRVWKTLCPNMRVSVGNGLAPPNRCGAVALRRVQSTGIVKSVKQGVEPAPVIK